MLRQLQLKNIAIVDHIDVSFNQGMTVITGETGSGKSILLDALWLVFGEKVSPKDVLKHGTTNGRVELLFDAEHLLSQPTFQQFLSLANLDWDDAESEILISREFTLKGSRCRINGIPINRELLNELRPLVVDLHGQHELTNLFNTASQLRYLDQLGGEKISTLKLETATAYQQWQDVQKKLDELDKNWAQFQQQLEFKRFQLNELEEAELENPDEDVETKAQLQRASNSESLIKLTKEMTFMLGEGDYENPSLIDKLAQLQKKLSEANRLDDTYSPVYDKLLTIIDETRNLWDDISLREESLSCDPETLKQLVERLDTLETLKRKYSGTGNQISSQLAQVIKLRDALREELDGDEADLGNRDKLAAQCETLKASYQETAKKLSNTRQKTAVQFKNKLAVTLKDLALPAVSFDINFIEAPPTAKGIDDIQFMFSANPGEPLRPLSKVASGGELSRFLLALKVLIAEKDAVNTLIFDEIDTGISGPVAKTVAEKLSVLSTSIQVIVITHQLMTAAFGDHHLHVHKDIQDNTSTRVTAESIQTETRRREILARLVSGVDNSEKSKENSVDKFIKRLCAEADEWKTSSRHSGQEQSAPVLQST